MIRVPNSALWWVLGGAGLALTATLTLPLLRRLFSIAPLHADDLAISLLAGVASLLLLDALKVMWGRSRMASAGG
jgi:Ca2+-transporting ATPase